MKTNRLLSLVLLLLAAPFSASAAECTCAECKRGEACQCGPACQCAAQTEKSDVQLHPLVGVVRDVVTDRQALLVKHEEIPGFMKAMTMLLRVEPEVLSRVKKGDAIKAQLGRDAEGKWFLRDVAVTTPAS
jgi:Cu/Ag efflux protein CusF